VRSLPFVLFTRLIPIALVVLAIQRTVCAAYQPAHVAVQVVLALAAGAGAGAGSERGAFAGFALGMMYDLGVGTPLGLSALAYGLAGLTAGYVLSITPEPQWWLASIFVVIGAAVGEGSIPFIKFLTGQDGWIDQRLLKVIPIVAVSAGLLAPLFVPLGRWCVGAKRRTWRAIVDE
jgi:cell shape-determining protein MreD